MPGQISSGFWDTFRSDMKAVKQNVILSTTYMLFIYLENVSDRKFIFINWENF